MTGIATAAVADPLVPHSAVCALFDCTEMCLWRWVNDKRYSALRFPQPVRINRRLFWRRSELDAFIARQAAARDGGGAE